MQRKATKQSRAANAIERQHMAWLKDRQICAVCRARGPVICHHMYGSTAKIKVDLVTIQVGHAAVLGLCRDCDDAVTLGSRRAFTDRFGKQNAIWARQYSERPDEIAFDVEVVRGIMSYE